MKRLFLLLVLVSAGLLLGTPPVSAQEEEEMDEAEEAVVEEEAAQPPAGLTMQMSNGWQFTFAGNVNAFYTYTNGEPDEDEDVEDPGSVTGGLIADEQTSRVRTGLLPAFAVFEAKGRERGVDLGVHFGFAPQIQTGGVHDNFSDGDDESAGAQIDMRQVYAFVSGETWGQVLFGREIGLYQRQNILTDMTLFGAGSSGVATGAKGTTLGRIGVGYIYPNFNAGMVYSTPAGRPVQFSAGLYDPSFIGDFTVTKTPRVEAELTYNGMFGEGNSVLFWAGGLVQSAEDVLTEGEAESNDVTALGGHGGLRLNVSGLSILGSGYVGEGVGTTLMFNLGVDDLGNERTSYGYIGQLTFTPRASTWTLGASYGDSRLECTDEEEADATIDCENSSLVESNRSIVGTVVWQATQSLKVVAEYAHTESESHANTTFKEDQGAVGLMLFF